MEFYPSPKRLRSDDYDIPESSCSYTFTPTDEYSTGALGLPVVHPPAESYQSWSSGFQYPAVFDLDIVQKRRRVDGSEELNMPYSTFSSYEHHAGMPYQRPDYSQSLQLQTSEYNGAGSSTFTSPISRSMASLSFLFSPCCGFDQEQSGRGGYQQLPEASLLTLTPDNLHVAEKMTSKADSHQPKTETGRFPAYSATSLSMVYPIQDHAVPQAVPYSDYNDYGEVGTRQDQLLGASNPVHPTKQELWPVRQGPLPPPPPPPPATVVIHQEQSLIPLGGAMVQGNNGYSGISALTTPLVPQPGEVITSVLPLGTPTIPTSILRHIKQEGDWDVIPYLGNSSKAGAISPNPRTGKRGPFKEAVLREQTAQTRKIGSCLRCRMQRIRCEYDPEQPDGDCVTCMRVFKTKTGHFPCMRFKISDIKLFKPGQVPGFEWTRRWSYNISDSIQVWSSTEVKVIRVSEGYSKQALELKVRQFVPQEGDKLERTWDDNGVKRSVTIPPYALMNMEEVKAAYERYICDSMIDAMPKFIGPAGELIHLTYKHAWQMCRSSSTPSQALTLLSCAFRLWTSIRYSTASGFIVGEETLGMSRDILDSSNPNHGMIPIPPVLGAQLDVILIHHIQTKLRRELLERLQKVYLKNKAANWLLLYLVNFMLLHNAALITAHDASYARKHGMKRRYAREDKVKEYHMGGNILLAHFHYSNKGVRPFSDECKDDDLRTIAALNDDQIKFVHATRLCVKRQRQGWKDLQAQNDYTKDYFFISQLYEENWRPRSCVV